jgi:hypothetical protein
MRPRFWGRFLLVVLDAIHEQIDNFVSDGVLCLQWQFPEFNINQPMLAAVDGKHFQQLAGLLPLVGQQVKFFRSHGQFPISNPNKEIGKAHNG